MAERDNIQTILRRAGWTVQVAPLSATRYRMTAQREAPLEHRKRSANAVANLLRENGYSAGVVAVTVAGFDIDAKPIKAERAVVRAAKRAGLKVSDDSPRVIAGAVRGIQRQWIRSRQDFESSETFPAARAITLKTMDLWKRVLAQYPSVAGIAPKTRINGLLSPSGWRMVLTQKVTPHDYHNAVLTSLGTIAQYFEKQG